MLEVVTPSVDIGDLHHWPAPIVTQAFPLINQSAQGPQPHQQRKIHTHRNTATEIAFEEPESEGQRRKMVRTVHFVAHFAAINSKPNTIGSAMRNPFI
jgi:hypothetical protein